MPITQEAEAGDCFEFEVSLNYTMILCFQKQNNPSNNNNKKTYIKSITFEGSKEIYMTAYHKYVIGITG